MYKSQSVRRWLLQIDFPISNWPARDFVQADRRPSSKRDEVLVCCRCCSNGTREMGCLLRKCYLLTNPECCSKTDLWCVKMCTFFTTSRTFQRWTSTHKEKTHPYHFVTTLWGWERLIFVENGAKRRAVGARRDWGRMRGRQFMKLESPAPSG